MKVLIIASGLCGLALSILGAVGAHLMAPDAAGAAAGWHQLDANAWNSAMLYGFAHTLAALIATALPARRTIAGAAGWAFVLGTILFSFSIMAMEILLIRFVPASNPAETMQLYDRITVVTPAGGIAFMIGWILLIAAALMKRREA
jgi:uncharacterized membrane protein YgdD (TMEM256/DUF423 family)